ncbi:multi-sensor signal transduction histidine kinase [Pseudodesulfovibrio mercurii]|uniref:histidine kinase n=1 Tax=Pseudodesulfovibrio mercurii TaxID=641491 RepID=F0JD75_9BACT|nr:PAS domain S-box protein [Pseudodesulfovibrio mercurii]EGB15749.1 multi-sensor signal transduction histidine kinase [Pseudodesulfovibrio mercurii]
MLRRITFLIPPIIGLMVAVMVYVGYRADQDNHGQKVRAQVVQALNEAKAGLDSAIGSGIHLASAMEAFLKVNPDPSQAQFAVLADALLVNMSAVRSLQLARNDVISHAYPSWSAGKGFGRSLAQTGPVAVRSLLKRAKSTGRRQILALDERAPDMDEIVILAPVFLPDKALPASYWGMISVHLDGPALFRNVGIGVPGDVLLALREKISEEDREPMLAGDPVVFDMDPVVRIIHVPSGEWLLAAAPSGGWGGSPNRNAILGFGLLAIVVLPMSLWALGVILMGRLKDRERYYQLVHSAKSIIIRINMAGDIVFCNEYAEDFYGYGPGELLGRPLVGTLVPRKSLEGRSMRRYLDRLLMNPSAHPFNETMNVRKNGEIVWVAWANDSVRSKDGTTVGLLCVGTDITDRKLMEEALRQREKQYRLLAENVTDIIWGLDADYRFTYVSPSDEAVRGFKRPDVLGRPIRDFLTPAAKTRFQDSLRVLDDLAETQGQLASITEDLEFTCADGSSVWLESHLGILFSEEGERIGLQGVSRDITDRKRAEALREDMERMARHDLKTPLGAVIGLPDEIRRHGNLDASQEAMLATIESAGTTMLELINRSLDLYKMECGTYVLDRTTVDVLDVLEQIKAECLPHIIEKGISVGIEVRGGEADGTLPVSADAELFRSMLCNLATNALEASPESGSVSIVLERTDHLTITIRNQGEVPLSVRETFFDKYSTSSPARGSGLGTYSARLIARTHGGDIAVETGTPGETSVIVTLPQ